MSDVPEAVRESGAGNLSSHMSARECLAMRELDADDDYTRSEIAFMFEAKSSTVARHCDGDCDHHQWAGVRGGRTYSTDDLLTAFRLVYERQPYARMSQDCYDDFRPDGFPGSSTIQERFGSWPTARKRARGGRDE